MSKKVEGKNVDDGPIAYINSAGKILECNLDFARLCGKQITQMIGRELTEQCKFDNPNALLEAAFQLDQLASGSGDLWRAGFLTVLNTEDEYEVTVRRCARKIRHHSVMEAVVSKIHRSGSVGAGEAQRRESIRKSMKLDQKIALSEEVDSGHAKAEEKVGSGRFKSDGKDAKAGTVVLTPQKDGLQALKLLQQERFDIVLMDINMPNMDGLEASHQFRMIEQQRRKSGFDAFIPKPLTEEGFLEVLHMQPNQNL
eukprot:gene29775-35953_t